MAQDALNRFWWPVLMMFGPSDKESLHSADTMKWKIKRFSNDDLRQKFVDATVPQGHYLGLDVSRPRAEVRREERALALRRDRLVASSSACWPATAPATASACRCARRAHEDGAWVREAALAHARKRAERAAAARIAAE